MFWRKKEQPSQPFNESAFDAALEWCQEEGEQVTLLSSAAFDVQLGSQVVHVGRHQDDNWLNAWAILPEAPIDMGKTAVERVKAYEALTERQFKNLDVIMDLMPNGQIIIRFTKLMRYQGSIHWMVFNMLSTFDYILNNDASREIPIESNYFYVNGRRFTNASEALIYYFKKIRREKMTEDYGGYIGFETGGMLCLVDLNVLGNEFVMRYAFSDFYESYALTTKAAINAQYIAAAYRKPNTKTASYVLTTGITELAISGVLTQGTEARPIFTRTLAEIYQVVLDSTERLKMNKGLVDGSQLLHSEQESIEQAALFEGDLTGGVENLEENQ